MVNLCDNISEKEVSIMALKMLYNTYLDPAVEGLKWCIYGQEYNLNIAKLFFK